MVCCSLEAALRLVVCSVSCPVGIYTSHCPSRWQNIIRDRTRPGFPDVQSASHLSLLLSGARHRASSSICVSRFWLECIHLFSNHNKIIFCCTFFPLSPNYLRPFLLCRHCQSNTGPLLSTTGLGALQSSYCVTSKSQTSSLDQGLLSFNSSLQHFPHLYVGAAVPAAERSG